MDWLARYKITIDCEKNLISFLTSEREATEFKGRSPWKLIPIISTMQALKRLKKQCQGYLGTIKVAELKRARLE